jgi:hypothetical protein
MASSTRVYAGYSVVRNSVGGGGGLIAGVCADAAPPQVWHSCALPTHKTRYRSSSGMLSHAEPMDNIVDLTTDYFYHT